MLFSKRMLLVIALVGVLFLNLTVANDCFGQEKILAYKAKDATNYTVVVEAKNPNPWIKTINVYVISEDKNGQEIATVYKSKEVAGNSVYSFTFDVAPKTAKVYAYQNGVPPKKVVLIGIKQMP